MGGNLMAEGAVIQEINKPAPKTRKTKTKTKEKVEQETTYSCLRNEIINVRPVLRNKKGLPKGHELYGGMAEGSFSGFTVPLIEGGGGALVQVLDSKEAECLEQIMGLEEGDLSFFKAVDNFWENRFVKLVKGDNFFNLSNPLDYINYKILLANKDKICPSQEEYELTPKETYSFVVTSKFKEKEKLEEEVNNEVDAFIKLGSITSNPPKMRTIIELIERKPVSSTTDSTSLKGMLSTIIKQKPSKFLEVFEDELLDNRVLINLCLTAGLIYKRGDYYYLKEDNSPLCLAGESPTVVTAAKYLDLPQNNELKLKLESSVKR